MCWLYKNKDLQRKWRIKKGGGPLGINLVHDIVFLNATTSNKIRKFDVEDTAVVHVKIMYIKCF